MTSPMPDKNIIGVYRYLYDHITKLILVNNQKILSKKLTFILDKLKKEIIFMVTFKPLYFIKNYKKYNIYIKNITDKVNNYNDIFLLYNNILHILVIEKTNFNKIKTDKSKTDTSYNDSYTHLINTLNNYMDNYFNLNITFNKFRIILQNIHQQLIKVYDSDSDSDSDFDIKYFEIDGNNINKNKYTIDKLDNIIMSNYKEPNIIKWLMN